MNQPSRPARVPLSQAGPDDPRIQRMIAILEAEAVRLDAEDEEREANR